MDFDSFKRWYRREIGKFGTLVILVIIAIVTIMFIYIFLIDARSNEPDYSSRAPKAQESCHTYLTTPDA